MCESSGVFACTVSPSKPLTQKGPLSLPINLHLSQAGVPWVSHGASSPKVCGFATDLSLNKVPGKSQNITQSKIRKEKKGERMNTQAVLHFPFRSIM